MQIMQLPSLACSLLALASLASCRALRPRAGFGRYEIPRLETYASSNGGNTSISFTFHASNTNTSSTCSASFLYPNPPNSTAPSFPTTRRSCSPDKYFGWTFSSFDGIESFVIDLTHTYQDPEVGDPPLDWVTTFGHRNITAGTSTGSSTNSTEAQYVCTSGEGVGAGRSCSIAEGTGPILVKITEAIAKRR